MSDLNFKHLYYFYIVAKEGSIKEAASKLHVSQPTISDQIKLLEQYFNCKLFRRKNRGLLLTPEGELTQQYAEKMFSSAKDLTARLRQNVEIPKKQLDVGISHSISQYMVYDRLMPLFNQKEISINIQESKRQVLLAELEAGMLDLVITDTRENVSPNINAHRMGTNKTFILCHKDITPQPFKYPEDLSKIPYFSYTTDSNLKYELDLYFAKHNITPVVVGEGDDIELIEKIVVNRIAFVIVSEATKNRIRKLCPYVSVLGEIKELQSTVWGYIKSTYKGLGYELIKDEF